MTGARLLASLLSPAGTCAALSILIYHRVHAQADELFPEEPDAARFDEQLAWLGSTFNVLPLDAACRRLQAGKLPSRAAAVTFDDGYADNETVALPILRKHGMSATFFIASDFLDGGRMWNDTVIEAVRRCRRVELDLRRFELGHHRIDSLPTRRRTIDTLLTKLKYQPHSQRAVLANRIAEVCEASLPRDLMMTTTQVRGLRRSGMSIGAHTRTHPILTRLSDAAAFEEIAGGKTSLEALLGEPVSLFAYPNGKPGEDYRAQHREMVVRAGYDAAVSTSIGVARRGTDIFQLPRFTPWDRTRVRFGLRLVDNLRRTGAVDA